MQFTSPNSKYIYTFFLNPWRLFASECELPHVLPVPTFMSLCIFKLSVNMASN